MYMSENLPYDTPDDAEARKLLDEQLIGMQSHDQHKIEETNEGLMDYVHQYVAGQLAEDIGKESTDTPEGRLKLALAAQWSAYHVADPLARARDVEQATKAVAEAWHEFTEDNQE